MEKLDLSEAFRHLTAEQGVALAFEITLCDEHQAAEMLTLSVDTLRQWRSRRKGPEFCKIGTRVVYPLKSIRNYIQNLPTAEMRS